MKLRINDLCKQFDGHLVLDHRHNRNDDEQNDRGRRGISTVLWHPPEREKPRCFGSSWGWNTQTAVKS